MGLKGIALVFGIVITAMISIFGKISGTHINTAVIISLAFGKSISKKDPIYYVFFQILGAIIASVLLQFMFKENKLLGVTFPSEDIAQSLLIEFVLTFFLMLTILGVTPQKNKEITSLSRIVIGQL